MATLIELLVVLTVVLILYGGVVGFGRPIEFVTVALAAVAAVVLVFVAVRFLSNQLGGVWTGGPRRRKRGSAAEALDRLRKGEVGTAEILLRRCVERDPSDLEAVRGLAEIALRRGDGDQYLRVTSELLARPDALRPTERVMLCHRQADVCLEQLGDPARAVEALARVELDYPGTAEAVLARQRIERILSVSANESAEN